jgi:hypothetical protein
MTETREQGQTASLYEQLRDSAPKEAAIEWRDGDRWVSYLRERNQELAADESLSDQGKFDKAQRYLEAAVPKIQRGYEKAAKLLRDEAQRKALASLPLPDGRDLNTKAKDSAGLLAIQGEAQAIVSKIERMREKLPKGMRGAMSDPATDVLRDAYASAMDDGGIEGMARARGALRAAEQLGVDKTDVVAPFMERKHYEAADEARRLEHLAQQVPSARAMIPANPFSPQSSPKSEYHTRRGGNLLVPRSSTAHELSVKAQPRSTTKRRPWK